MSEQSSVSVAPQPPKKVIRIYRQKELAQMERGWAQAHADVGAAIDASLAPHPKDCKPGCNHCCSLRVDVLPPEAARIIDYVRENWMPAERQKVLNGLRERAAHTDDDPATYRSRNLPCVFLGDEGQCRVYAIRPLTCRGFASSNVRICSGELPDDGESSYSAAPDELHMLINTSGLFWTEMNKAMADYWMGLPISVEVTPEQIRQVQAMQKLCEMAERGLLRRKPAANDAQEATPAAEIGATAHGAPEDGGQEPSVIGDSPEAA